MHLAVNRLIQVSIRTFKLKGETIDFFKILNLLKADMKCLRCPRCQGLTEPRMQYTGKLLPRQITTVG